MNSIDNSLREKPFPVVSHEVEPKVFTTPINSSKMLSESVLTRIINIIKNVPYQTVNFVFSTLGSIKQIISSPILLAYQPQVVAPSYEIQLKEAQTRVSQAESALVYIQQLKLRNWAEINIHYTTSFNELIDSHSTSFDSEKMSALKDHVTNYYVYFDSVRKTIENINSSQQVIDLVELFSEKTKILHDQIRITYTSLATSPSKRALFDLTKAFTTAIKKQQAIFKTPSSDPYLYNLQINLQEALSHLEKMNKINCS